MKEVENALSERNRLIRFRIGNHRTTTITDAKVAHEILSRSSMIVTSDGRLDSNFEK